MSNRCPDCQKFVSLEQADPEADSLEIDDAGNLSGDVRLALECQECGTEMKETTISVDEIATEAAEHIDAMKEALERGESDPDEDEHVLSVDSVSCEPIDRYQNKDRHGKPIKSFRYMRHFYGAAITVEISCSCGETFTHEFEVEEQASAFDEVY